MLVVFTDAKGSFDRNNDGLIDAYEAVLINASDYYPFGSPMPNRKFSGVSYRYGFQGQEKDDEVKGEGNSLDFGARIYDSRLGRWLAIDPKIKSHESPYAGLSGNPILFIDPDGRDTIVTVTYYGNSLIKNAADLAYFVETGDKMQVKITVETKIVNGEIAQAATMKISVNVNGTPFLWTEVQGDAPGDDDSSLGIPLKKTNESNKQYYDFTWDDKVVKLDFAVETQLHDFFIVMGGAMNLLRPDYVLETNIIEVTQRIRISIDNNGDIKFTVDGSTFPSVNYNVTTSVTSLDMSGEIEVQEYLNVDSYSGELKQQTWNESQKSETFSTSGNPDSKTKEVINTEQRMQDVVPEKL